MNIISVLSPLLFYIFPITIGALFVGLITDIIPQKSSLGIWIKQRLIGNSLFRRSRDHELPFLHSAIHIAMLFSFGALILLVVATLLDSLSLFSTYFIPVVFSLAGLGLVRIFVQFLFAKSLPTFPVKKIALLIFISLISYGIWSSRAPHPLNWDLYEHQTLVYEIQKGSFSFFTNQMSDTFGFLSYPPTFHILLSLSQQFISHTPDAILEHWQILSLLHLIVVTLTAYIFARTVTHNSTISLTTAILSAFLFDSVVSFTSHFILPQTVAAVIAVLLWSKLWLNPGKSVSRTQFLYLNAVIGLLMMHFVIGAIGAVLIFLSWAYSKLANTFRGIPKWSHYLIVLLITLSGYLIAQKLDLSSLNRGEAAAFSIPFFELGLYMRQIYGYLLLTTLPFGIYAFLRKPNDSNRVVIFITIGLTGLIVTGLPYVLKFITIARFFWILLAGTGISWLAIKSTSSEKSAQKLAIFVSIFLGVFLLLLNSASWQQHLHTHGSVRHISDKEIAAANFLQTLPADRTMIISDPATQYILESLSGINSPGGAFSSQEHRTIMRNLYTSEYSREGLRNVSQFSDALDQAPQKEKYLVLSGRSFQWFLLPETQQRALDFNIWKPYTLSMYDRSHIKRITAQLGQDPVFENTSVVIFKL